MVDAEVEAPAPVSKNRRYRKDKPWDTDDIDHWKMDKFEPGDMKSHLLDESSFATLFPKYREKYLQQVWPNVVSTLKEYGIHALLDLIEGSMAVKTTRKTWDPYMIIKARDMIKLLARSVPYEQAKRVLDDEMTCDIVKIGNVTRNKERFIKRRQRLVGPNGNTLKALELLTECYIKVQGSTVACLGPYKGIKQVRKIIVDTMNNIHPIYNIKILMTKRELMKDDTLKTESWDRFLPQFKKKNVPTKKPKKTNTKKKYTPFPPPQQPSKIDLQLESGEYFLKENEKKQKKIEEKEQKSIQKSAEKKSAKAELFKAPVEGNVVLDSVSISTDIDLSALKSKIKKNKKLKTIVPVEQETSSTAEEPIVKKKKKKLNVLEQALEDTIDAVTEGELKPKKKKKSKTTDIPQTSEISEPAVEITKKKKKSKEVALETPAAVDDGEVKKKKRKKSIAAAEVDAVESEEVAKPKKKNKKIVS